MERKILIGTILIILGLGGIFGSVLMFNDTSKEFMTTSFDIPLGVVPPEIPVSWFLGFCSIIFFVVGIIYLIRGKLSTGKIIAVILLILVVSGGAIFWEFLTALDAINHYWAQNQEILSDKYCDTDDDCACGINKTTRSCFYGNKDYVDTMQQCPDFCTGIGGNFEIKCINKECKQVSTIQDETADWNNYSDPKSVFTFKYPTDWEIKTDYQYRSASCQINPDCEGVHYIFLNKISDSRPSNLGKIEKFGIGINMPQCAGVKMDDLPGNNWICVFDENSETLDIYEKIKNSFQLIEDVTANWKTYRNEEYGFEVRYPPDFKGSPGIGSFLKSNFALVNTGKLPQGTSLTEFIKEFNKYLGLPHGFIMGDMIIDNVAPITVSGREAVQIEAFFSSSDRNGIETFISNGSDIFYIQTYDFTDINMTVLSPEVKQVHNQILSTFRFLK
jgi:hypothetical protein